MRVAPIQSSQIVSNGFLFGDGSYCLIFYALIVLYITATVGNKITNRIKVQRVIKNITQEELAAPIGVTRKIINTIETGKFVPSSMLAIILARYFEIKFEELFTLV